MRAGAVVGYRLAVVGYRVAVARYRLVVVRYRLAAATYRLAVVGYRLAVVGPTTPSWATFATDREPAPADAEAPLPSPPFVYSRRVPSLLLPQLDALEQHEIPPEYDRQALQAFIAWSKASSGAELANAQKIFDRLCQALHVPDTGLKKAGDQNPYVFEEDVKEGKKHRRIDVYRRGCFVFEAKQGIDPKEPGRPDAIAAIAAAKAKVGHTQKVKGAGVRGSTDWADEMQKGRHQAGNYAVQVTRRGDPKPPFLFVADAGYKLWIWSSFTQDARDDYGDFELGTAFSWDDLARPEVFKLLRQIWLTPEELDEEAHGARVSADIAILVGKLAMRLEKRFAPAVVGDFLMKCVFTMFAEDVGFLPNHIFTARLQGWVQDARGGHEDRFVRGLRNLWTRMRDGGDLESGDPIRQFNGYLFKDSEPLALQTDEMDSLLETALADWRRVSPAIFGTLLERALSPEERQRLGAFYTPEAYIRRLVDKTIMMPLRAQWTDIRAEMELELRAGKDKKKARKAAIEIGHAFRKQLTVIRVLDPACGSGNFLYVALKEMKRLESEVVRALDTMGSKQTWFDMPGETVHPAQFFGIELKPWAAKIAELVLWIGYLQWQVSAGRLHWMRDPLLQDLHHIRNADALIKHNEKPDDVIDKDGKPVLRARGVTNKQADRVMVAVTEYTGVAVAEWPDAEYIVGNPPFLGNKRLNDVLNPGYVEAIKKAYPAVPKTADLVMYWWWRCAELLRNRKTLRRFGLVTTNSITQKFNRAVVAGALGDRPVEVVGSSATKSASVPGKQGKKTAPADEVGRKGIRIAYAVADHPWFDEGASVRIAMTVADCDTGEPVIAVVTDEKKTKAADLAQVCLSEAAVVAIHSDLASGVAVESTVELMANDRLTFQGMNPVGEGFRLSPAELKQVGYSDDSLPPVVRPYLIGRDLVRRLETRYIIDFFGIGPQTAQTKYPMLWERLLRLVKPEREKNNRESRRKNWWLFGEPVGKLRVALASLRRYVATCRTARQRIFVFVDVKVIPDTKIVAIAVEDAAILATLSSRVHVLWSLRLGGWLGVGNDPTYNHLDCFGKFPFPSLSPSQTTELRSLGERLEAHRKGRQAAHPDLALTDAYNVLDKLRENNVLDAAEEKIRNMALVDTMRHLHDEIDRVTLSAYGWPVDLSDEAIIEKLVDLNVQRAAEEKAGRIRWLRPDYQAALLGMVEDGDAKASGNPDAKRPAKRAKPASALPWPADMPGRIHALKTLLRELGDATETRLIAMAFKGAKLDEVELNLRCAMAADAVIMTETEAGDVAWMARPM